MEELYERRQAALEYHRAKFKLENRNRYMKYRSDVATEDEID